MVDRKRRHRPEFVTYPEDPTFGAAPAQISGAASQRIGGAQGDGPIAQAAGARAAYQGLYLG